MSRYLLSFDFDLTVANTSEPNLHGISVPKAYNLAIRDVFGEEGLVRYMEIGGLKNRAPSELVHEMLSGGNQDRLLEHAQLFAQGTTDNNPVHEITELLVQQKLDYLLAEIGTELPDGSSWPRLYPGFADLWRTSREMGLETAIVSSGHQAFIEKCFAMWQLEQPDILVTEDNVRWRTFPEDIKRRIKPGTLQLALAHQEWLRRQNFNGDSFSLETARESKRRMMYFGDDSHNDGQMAENTRILFGWFNPGNTEQTVGDKQILISDWNIMASRLKENQAQFLEGRPFEEIFVSSGQSPEGNYPNHCEKK